MNFENEHMKIILRVNSFGKKMGKTSQKTMTKQSPGQSLMQHSIPSVHIERKKKQNQRHFVFEEGREGEVFDYKVLRVSIPKQAPA